MFALNHVVHHNPSVWGKYHDQFIQIASLAPTVRGSRVTCRPSAWASYVYRQEPGDDEHFEGALSVLRNYKLEMLHPEEPDEMVSVGISEKKED